MVTVGRMNLAMLARWGLIQRHHPDGIGAGGGGRVVSGSSFKKMTIYDLGSQIRGKRVLVRCDFNGTAKNGEIASTTRIDAALKSIQYILDQGAAQVILLSHNGRNKRIVAEGADVYTLAPVAEYLSEKLELKTDFVKGFDKPLSSTARLVLMENTRVDARDEVKDPAANEAYAREILAATNSDIYVIDGFSVCHRAQASVTWLAKLMGERGKLAVAGELLRKEYEFFVDRIIKNPAKPFLVFLGGAKVLGPGGSEEGGKLQIIKALLPNVDNIVIGGAMALPFMLEKGYKVEAMDPFRVRIEDVRAMVIKEQELDGHILTGKGSKELVEQRYEEAQAERADELNKERAIAQQILGSPDGGKIIIPTLAIGEGREIVNIETALVPEGFVMKDLSIKGVARDLSSVGYRTIFFNGTFGAYEEELGGHVEGTHGVLRFMSRETAKSAITIPGGGDTMKVLKQIKDLSFTHKTTGGGASGELIVYGFSGRPEALPGFACLTDR